MVILLCALTGAWGQDSSDPLAQPMSQSEEQQQEATSSTAQQDLGVDQNDLVGLDLPSVEPDSTGTSYWQVEATANQSVSSNAGNSLEGGPVTSISRALGNLTLQRLWHRYTLGLAYVGGVGYYDVRGEGFKSLQQMNLGQHINWRGGQFGLRDSFAYMPEGNFGGAYGALGSTGIGLIGTPPVGGFFGGTTLGSIGLAPRITNVSLADAEQALTPKSEVSAAGAYAFVHFFGNLSTGGSFVDSSQISAEGAYNRLLTPHTQMGVVYGYQDFDFSVAGTAFRSELLEGIYRHQSGRVDLLLGAGPQVTFYDTPTAVCSNPVVPPLLCTLFGGTLSTVTAKTTKPGVVAQARLMYQSTSMTYSLLYARFQSNGSGLFAGTQADVARFDLSHRLSRNWLGHINVGYARETRDQPLTTEQVSQCTSPSGCPANDATVFENGFAGVGVRHEFSRDLHAYFNYEFNEGAFNSSYCVTGIACNRISHRQIGTVGLDWTPRPMRID